MSHPLCVSFPGHHCIISYPHHLILWHLLIQSIKHSDVLLHERPLINSNLLPSTIKPYYHQPIMTWDDHQIIQSLWRCPSFLFEKWMISWKLFLYLYIYICIIDLWYEKTTGCIIDNNSHNDDSHGDDDDDLITWWLKLYHSCRYYYNYYWERFKHLYVQRNSCLQSFFFPPFFALFETW